jgi:sporulation protein YtfJ
MENPINNFMKISMENLKNMVDVDTVVGEPMKVGDETIIPVSKVRFGFAAGGSEFEAVKSSQSPVGGGTGGGFTITPIAFLIIGPNGVELKHLEERTHIYERLMEQVPKTLTTIMNEFEKSRKN